jgi:hypothetical protein
MWYILGKHLVVLLHVQVHHDFLPFLRLLLVAVLSLVLVLAIILPFLLVFVT